jgi:hypothetical protein
MEFGTAVISMNEKLASCYTKALLLAKDHHCKSLFKYINIGEKNL